MCASSLRGGGKNSPIRCWWGRDVSLKLEKVCLTNFPLLPFSCSFVAHFQFFVSFLGCSRPTNKFRSAVPALANRCCPQCSLESSVPGESPSHVPAAWWVKRRLENAPSCTLRWTEGRCRWASGDAACCIVFPSWALWGPAPWCSSQGTGSLRGPGTVHPTYIA